MKNIAWKISLLLITLFLLIGCKPKIEETKNNTASDNHEVTAGAVVAAPIDGAGVEAYINNTWVAVGRTKNGDIHFSDLEKITTYPVQLRANARRQGAIAKDTYLQAELRGIMMSRDDSPYITPVTTLAAILFQLNGSTATAANQAKTRVTKIVHNVLGFNGFNPFANPLGDALPKHEVLQQAFMTVLNLGEETDYNAMQSFIPTLTAIAQQMPTDTFCGAAKKVNPKLTSSIAEYLTAQQATIVHRASRLLYDQNKSPIEQEKKRIELTSQMNEIMNSDRAVDEHAEFFVFTKIEDGSDAFAPLPSPIATPQKNNPIPLHFRVSLLSNTNSIVELTENKTKPPTPTYSGKFKISEISSAGILNEDLLLSPNVSQKITAGSKTYSNGTKFSFFFDASNALVGSTHRITFTATEDSSVTGTMTFIVKGRDEIIIESVESRGSSKLFTFDEGNNHKITEGSITTLSEGQLAATVKTAFDTATSEDVFNAVMMQFTAPSGFAFRSDGLTRTSVIVAVLPTAEDKGFTFSLPSTLDIVATAPSPVGKKQIQIKVLDQKTKKIVTQTQSDVYFVPQSSLGTIADATMTAEPAVDITYSKDKTGTDILLESFIITCELKTWYDLAGVPKDQQPDSPINQYPATWKLRFNHAPTGSNGFKNSHGSYSTELDLQPYATSQATTPMQFELRDFRSLGGSDCRQTIKPFSPLDTLHLYFSYRESPDNEYMAKGSINIKEE
ncbi:hypothetical protein [Halodesulfovibrio marinisediminis]|nr:hypothetical protein [Halodesulfovibrio marinisediminis]